MPLTGYFYRSCGVTPSYEIIPIPPYLAQSGKCVAECKIPMFAPLLPGNHGAASWRDSLHPYMDDEQKMFMSLTNVFFPFAPGRL